MRIVNARESFLRLEYLSMRLLVMAATTTTKDITIVGGGIIGCTTAYFLTRHPAYSPATHRITLLEASSSSNSGGRTPNSVADPTALADAAAATAAEPARRREDGRMSLRWKGRQAKPERRYADEAEAPG